MRDAYEISMRLTMFIMRTGFRILLSLLRILFGLVNNIFTLIFKSLHIKTKKTRYNSTIIDNQQEQGFEALDKKDSHNAPTNKL